VRTHGVLPLARIAVGPLGARAADANKAGVVRDSRPATTDRVMSQPRGPSGPCANAAGHCKRVLLGTRINVSRGLHCFFPDHRTKKPRANRGAFAVSPSSSASCGAAAHLRRCQRRDMQRQGIAEGHFSAQESTFIGAYLVFSGPQTNKPSRPAREHSLSHCPAQRAVDPPPRGVQQANDVPGSSTPTARTQSDVRSFRVDVWRIIISLRAATSLDVGRAALQCGGVVSRASCVSLQCTSCRSRPGHSSTWCTYSSTQACCYRSTYRPTLARRIRPRGCALHVWNRSLASVDCHVLQLLSCTCNMKILRCIAQSLRADEVVDQPPATKCQLTAKIMDASLRTDTRVYGGGQYMATKVVFLHFCR
jgi:hypothetical protein